MRGLLIVGLLGLLGCWVCWIVGLLGCWVVGFVGLLVCWFVGLLGLLGCWIVRLLDCYSLMHSHLVSIRTTLYAIRYTLYAIRLDHLKPMGIWIIIIYKNRIISSNYCPSGYSRHYSRLTINGSFFFYCTYKLGSNNTFMNKFIAFF
jgi:hypothetical protein